MIQYQQLSVKRIYEILLKALVETTKKLHIGPIKIHRSGNYEDLFSLRFISFYSILSLPTYFHNVERNIATINPHLNLAM